MIFVSKNRDAVIADGWKQFAVQKSSMRPEPSDRYIPPDMGELSKKKQKDGTWKRGLLYGVLVVSGVLALITIIDLLRGKGKDDDPSEDDEPWKKLSNFIDELRAQDDLLKDRLKGVGFEVDKALGEEVGSDINIPRISGAELYEMSSRYIQKEEDLFKIGQALTVFLAAYRLRQPEYDPDLIKRKLYPNPSRRLNAINAALAMTRGDLGWAELWLDMASCKNRLGIDFKKQGKKVLADGLEINHQVTAWRYGEYYIEDFITALVRGILNLKGASLEEAQRGARWVLALIHKDKAGRDHPILTGLAWRILEEVNRELSSNGIELEDSKKAEWSVWETVIDKTEVFLPPPPDQKLSRRTQGLMNGIANDISAQSSPLENTTLVLERLVEYWGSAPFGNKARDALRSLEEKSADAIGASAHELLMGSSNGQPIGYEFDHEVMVFFHDLARSGMYYEAAVMTDVLSEKFGFIANVATTSVYQCEELGLPQEICDYVRNFRRMVTAEVDRIGRKNSGDGGSATNHSKDESELINGTNRPPGLLRCMNGGPLTRPLALNFSWRAGQMLFLRPACRYA